MSNRSQSAFDLHPVSVLGGLLAGRPAALAAARDAEPEPLDARPRALTRLAAALPRRRRKPQAAVSPRG